MCLSSTPAWSQATSTASIAGLVADEQGAAIPGAEVKLTDTATGGSQVTLSNDAGRYVFVNVSPGVYTVLVSKQGFTAFKVDAQKVDVGTAMTINATLKVGATTTTVEVTATVGADLQTTNATVGSTLSQAALLSLPNMGRDVSTLATLQPGTTPAGMTAGAFSDQNVFMLDGGNNSDDMAGNNTSYVTNFTGTGGTQTGGSPSGIVPTSVESIEEVKVSTFNQTADFSGSIGGQIQMVTKRGTNQYHGSAYGFYYATNIGAANTWTADHTPAAGLPYTPLPKNHRSRFGGSLGGVLLPKLLGGKTYFFANYEGSRFPNVGTYERLVPSPLLRAGVIQVADASGKFQAYNLNPSPVTVGGTTYQPASCGTGLCDPRGLGLNPTIAAIWKEMPLPNDPLYSSGDQYNTQGYLTTIRAPLNQNSYVLRVDHDFGDKNRFFGTYRYTKITNLTTNQVDIGGVLPGDTFGNATPVAARPQLPSFMAFGLTSSIKPTMTNTFNFNYTRNFWQWGASGPVPQVAGLGGMVEIGGESTNALIPFNVNSQNVRQRFWDGQDKTFKDDVTYIKGNHLIQFGGSYQRNFDYHGRTDNGQGINNQIVYQVTSSNTNFGNFAYPGTVPSNQQSNFNTLFSYVTGMVAQSQVVYTRAGSNLSLEPVGTSGFDQSVIPSYNVYLSDTWHIKPTVTLNYGLSYELEMPPVEANGKQVSLVDQNGNQVPAAQYLAQRQAAALAGQVDQPIFGFALTPNIAGHPKYPYDPFYGGLSPRVSVAWSPKYSHGLLGTLFGDDKTVIRAGYGRIFGRLNGVNLLLVPLLPPGLLQAVSCPGVSKGGQCLLNNGVDPSTVFRIGVDGNTVPLPNVSQTLSQPYFPGVGGNAGASDVTFLDPHYRPERTDNVTVTLQRQVSRTMSLEIGYVGRLIRNELEALNLDAVPYMTTLGGQSFATAYAQAYFATPASGTLTNTFTAAAQPFFETALGGANSAYCQGYVNCTSAVIAKNTTAIRNTAVSDLWTALYKAPSWILGRSLISQPLPGQTTSQGYTYISNSANGYGNYNALFVSYHIRDFHGITGTSNFTWGRALGTGTTSQATSSNTALDVYNMQNNYGPQSYDYKFLYNMALFYSPKVFRNQHGPLGKVLGGWTFSPLFTAQSGAPIVPGYSEGGCTGCQAFGEVSTTSSATTSFTTNAQGTGPFTGGTNANYNVAGSNGVGTNNPQGINMFSDPNAVLQEFRKCILGFDQSCAGFALRGLPRWNVDLSVNKTVQFWKEGVGADFSLLFTNVLNHVAMGNPTLTLTTPTTFGRITTVANTPRQMEFGLRLHF
ncbi:MAG TPA: carboxypeptidase-like regulatory domain-containing protein [Bryobacteraceae bacterium]|nr:carboxypeptidase-like regulatory domain-containing protein [Bryobacteraceae bacterium]